ncbi:MAG TPA: glycosyltransferase 87 family protein [candidate division Zixibacteria bacterium]|nr:glycosyltransferase 87 family protein [candidate division Zixibacteria bacterium]
MQRLAQRAVIGLAFAYALVGVYLILGSWGFEDVDAYWDAAMRLREGEPLYPVGQDPDNYRVYRYAPWFAWLWVPLTYLPQGLVEIGWGVVVGVAALAVLVALVQAGRGAGLALAFVLTPWMLSLVQVGNIQPLVVAMLGFGVSRRSGPLWVGISASLKAVPVVWALVYLARREWPRLAAALAVAALLSATFLLHDRTGYVTDPGRSGMSLYYNFGPAVWLAGIALSGTAALYLAWRRSEWLWPALAVAAMLIAPRSHITYTTFLAVGLLNGARDRIRAG